MISPHNTYEKYTNRGAGVRYDVGMAHSVHVCLLFLRLFSHTIRVVSPLIGKGEMERSEGGSITEGIGQGRVTGNLATCEGLIDGAFLVSDETCFTPRIDHDLDSR